MLFKRKFILLIITGKKIQTRRIWKEKYIRPKEGSIHQARVRMLGKEYFCKIKILDVHEQLLGMITHEEAVAEGFSNKHEFLTEFYEINRIPKDLQPIWLTMPVNVITFEVVKGSVQMEYISKILNMPLEELTEL